MAVLVGGAFISILNQTIMIPAVPVIMEEFRLTANTGQWLTTSFMLTNGIMIPVTAFLIEKYTTRTLFFVSMGLFAVGTAIAGVAPDYTLLLGGRIVQACGAGILMPLMQTVLLTIVPKERRGAAMGVVGLVISFAPALGPALGGWIVEVYSWRILLYVIVPFTVLDLALGYFTLKNVTELFHPKVDILSIVYSTLGFGGLLYGFSAAGSNGWSSPDVATTLIVGSITLALFIQRQLTMERPMLELRIFRYRLFTVSTIIGMIAFALIIVAEVILPIYLQTVRGFSALETGILLLPGAILMGLVSPIAGRIFDKYGARWLSIIGLLILTVSTLPFTQLTLTTSYNYLMFMYTVRLLGITLVMMPVTTAGLNKLPQRLIAHGTAMSNTTRQIAASIGPALLVTVMTSGVPKAEQAANSLALIQGANRAFLVAALIALFALALCYFIDDGKVPAREPRTKAKPESTA